MLLLVRLLVKMIETTDDIKKDSIYVNIQILWIPFLIFLKNNTTGFGMANTPQQEKTENRLPLTYVTGNKTLKIGQLTLRPWTNLTDISKFHRKTT